MKLMTDLQKLGMILGVSKMKLSKNNFGKKLPENIFLSFNWLKPLGLEIWFSFFEDEAELKLPYDIFPSLYV